MFIIKVNTNTLETSRLTKLNSGLSNQSVSSFAEDQNNVKWFATSYKVSALDEDEWTVYDTDNSGLPNNYGIYEVYAGSDNEKYFKVGSDLVVFDGISWTTYNEDNSPLTNFYYFIRAVSPNGTVYLTIGADIYSFFNGTFTLLSEINALTTNTSTIVCDQNNVAYFNFSGGLIRLEGDTFEVFDTANSVLPSNNIAQMVIDEDNGLWFKSANQVMRFQDGDFEQIFSLPSSYINESIHPVGNDQAYFKYYSDEIIFYDSGETTTIPFTLYSPYGIRIIHAVSEDAVWAEVKKVGLAYYNGIEWQMVSIPGASFQSDWVKSLALDNDGNPWFGFLDGGVHTFQDGEWIRYNNVDLGLSSEDIRSISQWGNKMVFSNGFQLSVLENDEFTVLDCTTETILCQFLIGDIANDDNENLWLVSSSGGSTLIKYDGSDWEIFDAFPGVSANSRCVYAASEAEIYIGSTDAGFSEFSNGSFHVYNMDNSPLPENSVYCFLKDQDGVLWIGTQGGLVKKDGEDWTVYNLDDLVSSYPSALNDGVRDISIDANGTLWLAVRKTGLVSFDGEADWNLWTYDNSNIIHNVVEHIEITPDGYKWIGTAKNVASFREASYTVSVLDNFDVKAGVSLYPNPSNGIFQIKTNPGDQILQTELIDIQGKVLKTWSSGQSTYDITRFDKRIYLLRVNLNGTSMTARILKQ